MMNKFLDFIKYNNFAVIILAIALIIGGGVFAAEPDAIGQKQTRVEGIDNTVLLAVDLANFNMDFKISKIEKDDKFYYIIYTYLDLAIINNTWQYQIKEKKRKVSQNLSEDLGVYLAGELKEEYDTRLKDLKKEQTKAEQTGPETRTEITDYSGLIGKTLDLVENVFPNYEPIKKVELPMIENFNLPNISSSQLISSGADNLTQVYNDYIVEHNVDINNNATSTSSNTIDLSTESTTSTSTSISTSTKSE
ncbi:MAG: hypothetical protein Q7T79_02870 [bacterium]|nr:hypothetical protein [bacterium]